MIKDLIQNLRQLAVNNFPNDQTTNYLKNVKIPLSDLNPYLFFNDKFYTRNLIYYSPEFEILAVCWMPGQKAPAHGHEGEKCWARVEQGQLRFLSYQDEFIENKLTLNLLSDFTADKGHLDGPAYIHAVENNSTERAISLHIYARPFKQCDVYINDKAEKKNLSYYSKFGKIIK